MNLNETPRSAAEYCYNRNKRRNSDGTVSDNDRKWFLPGIRQMEGALTKYYNTFPEFQDNYYWSSSAGERERYTDGQNPERARATKVKQDGSYEESGGQGPWGDGYKYELGRGGYAERDEVLRIRAFRVDLNPVN